MTKEDKIIEATRAEFAIKGSCWQNGWKGIYSVGEKLLSIKTKRLGHI